MHFFLEYLPVHWAMWTVSYWVLAPPLGAIQSVSTCYTAHTDTRATQNFPPRAYLLNGMAVNQNLQKSNGRPLRANCTLQRVMLLKWCSGIANGVIPRLLGCENVADKLRQ